MFNNLDIEDIEESICCDSCGSEFNNQEDIDELVYGRTTASSTWWYCPDCGNESISISENI